MDSLLYLTIEDPTAYATEDRNDYGAVESLTANPAHLPDPAMAPHLQRVLDDVDGATCDTPGCGYTIGYVLHEDDDGRPMGSGLTWRPITLVVTTEGIAVVCEDCQPDNLYAHAVTHRALSATTKENPR